MKSWLIAVAVARSLDVSSSLVVFHQGGYERNPLVVSQQPAAFVAQAAAVTAAEMWLLGKISRHHPKMAKALAAVDLGVESYVVVHNVHQIR